MKHACLIVIAIVFFASCSENKSEGKIDFRLKRKEFNILMHEAAKKHPSIAPPGIKDGDYNKYYKSYTSNILQSMCKCSGNSEDLYIKLYRYKNPDTHKIQKVLYVFNDAKGYVIPMIDKYLYPGMQSTDTLQSQSDTSSFEDELNLMLNTFNPENKIVASLFIEGFFLTIPGYTKVTSVDLFKCYSSVCRLNDSLYKNNILKKIDYIKTKTEKNEKLAFTNLRTTFFISTYIAPNGRAKVKLETVLF